MKNEHAKFIHMLQCYLLSRDIRFMYAILTQFYVLCILEHYGAKM